jgi:integrase
MASTNRKARLRTQDICDSFLADCELRGLSPRTLEGYRHHINRLTEISLDYPPKLGVIQRFLASFDGKYNADSFYRTFHALSKYAHKQYRAPHFMRNVTRPRIHREIMPTISGVELELLAWRVRDAPARDKAIICLFVDCAIREGEASNLRRSDVKEDRMIVHGKTGQRMVPISQFTRNLLLSLPLHQDGYVFHGQEYTKYQNERLRKTGFYHIVKKYLRAAGYAGEKSFGPQILRRSFGRFWLKDGGDMKSLSKILGHRSVKTTDDYYTPLLGSDMIEIHQKHSPGRAMIDVPQEV